MARRKNPPVDEIPEKFRSLAYHARVENVKPLGAGTFGVTFKAAPGWVRKITIDPAEVKVVREIKRLRGQHPSVSAREAAVIRRTGTSPERAARLPGIISYKGPVRKVASGWEYVREDVKPLDASRNASMLVAEADAALEIFCAKGPSGRYIHPDPARFLRRFPWMRRIVQTMIYLEVVHGVQLEDLHGEQVGVVLKSSSFHQRGEVVLFDAQVD